MKKIKIKKRVILLVILMLLFLFLLFPGFKGWIYLRYNCVDNLLLYGTDETIYEMTTGGFIVWKFKLPEDLVEKRYRIPFVQRLSNGNTLISESKAGIVYEVNRRGRILWKCDSLYKGNELAFSLKHPTKATGLKNGNILVGDYENGKVMEVDRNCNIIWQWDYENYNPLSNALSEIYRFDNGNTGILVYNNLWSEPSKVKEHCASVFFEYIELNSNRKIVKRFNLDMIDSSPMDAVVLPNKHILISYHPDGAIEFDTLNNVIWTFPVPETASVKDGPRPTEPLGASSSFRLHNGNTMVFSLGLTLYLVNPDGKILWRIESPVVKSKLGVLYIKEDGYGEDVIQRLLGIVDK